MVTSIKALGSLLTANVDERVLTYRLLPFGEEGRTSAGRLTVDAGVVQIPEDAATLVANMEHDHTRPVGRFVSVGETDGGLDCAVRVARTSQGDDLLVEAAEGLRTGISVELDDVTIRSGRLVAGRLTGAGFVARPAFASARLVAADVGDLPDDLPEWLSPGESSSRSVEEVVVDGQTLVVESESTTRRTVTVKDSGGAEPPAEPTGQSDTQEAAMADETTAAESARDQQDEQDQSVEQEPTDTDQQEEDVVEDDEKKVATASAPTGVRGMTARRATAAAKEPTVAEIATRFAAAYQSGGARGLAAALSDIVPADLTGVGQPAYLGELWSGRAHVRRFVPLFNHGELTSVRGVAGWRWLTKPAVAAYTGGKTAVPSNDATTEAITATPKRLAGAHDIDRIYRDFGDTEFYEAYYRAMTESYSRLSDAAALADAIAGATAATTAVADVSSDLGLGWTLVVDGALKVLAETDVPPTFAVVGTTLYRQMLLVPETKVLGYLSAALGLEEGQAENFKILPSSATALTTGDGGGKVLVGTRDAMTFHELPGSPIRAEAVDMVNGGIDGGLFGYYTTVVHDTGGLVLAQRAAA